MNNTEFNIPKNYFENFEDTVLKKAKKTNTTEVFLVPNNYFENLESSVLKKLKKRKKRVFYIKSVSIAAIFLLFISFSVLFKDRNNTINQSELIDYLSENMEDEEINEILLKEKNIDFNDKIISDKEIFNYFEEYDISEDELYNNI